MLLQPGVGLRSSLSLPGLDAIGAMPDLGLCDQIEHRGLDRRSAQDPLGPQLAFVLEAQAAWVDPAVLAACAISSRIRLYASRCTHNALSFISGGQTVQRLHAHRGLDVAQIQFDVPAARMALREVIFAGPAPPGQGRDQDLGAVWVSRTWSSSGNAQYSSGVIQGGRAGLGQATTGSRGPSRLPRRKSVIREPFCSNSVSTPARASVAIRKSLQYEVSASITSPGSNTSARPRRRLNSPVPVPLCVQVAASSTAGGQTDHDDNPRQRNAHPVGCVPG
jgi:hypothetical protein